MYGPPMTTDVGPPRRPSLRRNFSWTLFGNIFYAACQWGYIVVIAQLGSAELVGRFALSLAITAPVFMLANLGLGIALATDADDEHEFGQYLGLRLFTTAVALLFIGGIVFFGGYKGETVRVVLLLAVAKAIEAISDVVLALFQKNERMDILAKSMTLKGAISLLAMTAAMLLSESLELAMAALCLGWFVTLISWDLRKAASFAKLVPSFAVGRLSSLAWLALPLGVIAGLNSFGAQLPRYFMEHFGGEEALGLFTAPAALAIAALLVTRALSRSAVPRMALYFARKQFTEFKRLLARLMGLGLGVGVLGVLVALLLGKWFLRTAYGAEYESEHVVLMWVIVHTAVLATGTFLGTALTASRRFGVQVSLHALKIVAVAAACLILIPRYGALGAAWALLAGSIVSSIGYGVVLQRVLATATGSVVETARLSQEQEARHDGS